MNHYLIYIGKGKGTLPGVPARNLTKAEAEQHGIDILLKSGLYKIKKDLSEMNIVYKESNGDVEEKPKRGRKRKE